MTSLDHNRSRFGFSATRARLPVPRARLDRHDETFWTRPPSEEQPRVGFQSALTPVIHRHESHTPPNSSIQTKSFAAAQPPSRTPWVPSLAAAGPARSRRRCVLSKLALALPMALFAYHGSKWALLPQCSCVILRQVSGYAGGCIQRSPS